MHNSSHRFSISRPGFRRGSRVVVAGLLPALVGWGTAGVSRADIVEYNISFNDPGAFQFDPGSGPYALDFYLTAASTTTTVTGSNFSGSGTGAANDFTLNNSAGEAESATAFTPPTTPPAGNPPAGSPLSFNITANYTPGSLDTFSFGFYKNFGTGSQALVTTTEPAVAQSFFTIDFSNLGLPTTAAYSSNDPGFNIAAPTITLVNAVATPEPETWAMMLLGVCALAIIGIRRKSAEMA